MGMSDSRNADSVRPLEALPASGGSGLVFYEADRLDCCSACGRIWEAHLPTGGACPARLTKAEAAFLAHQQADPHCSCSTCLEAHEAMLAQGEKEAAAHE